MTTIREAIRELVKTEDNAFENLFAKVISVDDTEKTCEVETINDEMTIFDVRLIANSGDGVFITPSVDSIVGVCMINEVEGFVSLYSQIDSIQYGDGANGGLININDIVTKLNNLENDINSLKTAFTSWVAVPNDGGLALKTAAATWSGSSLTNTVVGDLENTTITHGDL